MVNPIPETIFWWEAEVPRDLIKQGRTEHIFKVLFCSFFSFGTVSIMSTAVG
jgi:hypothetical protein